MQLCRIPYRWLPRTFWKNIKSIAEDLFWYGPRNVIRWLPVIWMDADFDSGYLLDIMKWKLTRLADCLENGQRVDGKRDARRVRTAALLCNRLSNDQVYYDNAAKAYKYGSRSWANEITAVGKQDQEMLGRLIGKYITHWWD